MVQKKKQNPNIIKEEKDSKRKISIRGFKSGQRSGGDNPGVRNKGKKSSKLRSKIPKGIKH